MAFIDEFNSFLAANGIGQDGGIVPVALSASSPEEAELLHGQLAAKAGKVIFVVEDRWRSQGGTIKARLLAHNRSFRQVYARNCEVRRIDKPLAASFLSAAHSYGDAACRYRYGLFVERTTGEKGGAFEAGELVAVAEFSSARKWLKENGIVRSYEWIRYASLPGVRVAGGMGKLLDAFVKHVNPDDVMTYADLEWSDGGAYKELGFECEGFKEPVMLAIDPENWTRTALKPPFKADGRLFFKNFGSLKYRKKYTGL